MCHRCFSAMGGCGADGVNWRMFPWRDCGDSKFCVKVITRDGGKIPKFGILLRIRILQVSEQYVDVLKVERRD